jgi:peptidoglycan/xylan/chitin deacetylase (PgdA/CDA1 family)
VSEAALAVTVDVDGEAGLAGDGHSLSARSERRYGVGRGLERVLAVLGELGVVATFYVPGVTAQRHPEAIRALVALGHEVGHHGHTHRSPATLTIAEQRAEVEDGLAALAVLGIVPGGYRAPAWELTEATLALLRAHGFTHDSSLMDDDRPYPLGSLVELPVHWTLDDVPYFAGDAGGEGLARVWTREIDLAAEEARALTLTLHPEVLGRPHRIDLLRRVLEHAAARGLPAVTHGALATRCRPPGR